MLRVFSAWLSDKKKAIRYPIEGFLGWSMVEAYIIKVSEIMKLKLYINIRRRWTEFMD